MKILQIIPTLGSGGAERFVVDLCNELTKQGHEVILCTMFDLKLNEDYAFFKKNLNSSIEHINLNKKLGFDRSLFLKIYRVIKKYKPQVVHSHLSTLNYVFLANILLNNKVKFIHTLHSDARKLIKNKGEYFLRKFIYNVKLVKPVCISEESLKSFEELYSTDSAKMIYNGRKLEESTGEIENYDKEKFNTIFLHVGRFDEAKNQINLVKAFNNILKEYPKILLLIIGEGDKKIKLELEKYTSDHIILLGRKTNVNEYMKVSQAFILPSIFEGMPISLIEAMSHGLIPIVSRVGGMKNMVENMKNGLLLDGHDIESIEKGLLDFLNLEGEIKEEMKRKVKIDFLEKYSIEKCVKQYIEVYGF
ncbi:sucrose-phosphate synthase [Flavobacteriaceae bacterium UJ101]|nr:sucrose-phosphate synthase [Flavobacteriaceae bacterium UJ101]